MYFALFLKLLISTFSKNFTFYITIEWKKKKFYYLVLCYFRFGI